MQVAASLAREKPRQTALLESLIGLSDRKLPWPGAAVTPTLEGRSSRRRGPKKERQAHCAFPRDKTESASSHGGKDVSQIHLDEAARLSSGLLSVEGQVHQGGKRGRRNRRNRKHKSNGAEGKAFSIDVLLSGIRTSALSLWPSSMCIASGSCWPLSSRSSALAVMGLALIGVTCLGAVRLYIRRAASS